MATSNQNSNTDNSFLGDSNTQNSLGDQPQTVDLGAVAQTPNPSDTATSVEPLTQPMTSQAEPLAQPATTEAIQEPVVTPVSEVNSQGSATDTPQSSPVEDSNTDALSGYNIPGVTPDESTKQATLVMPETQIASEATPAVSENLTDEVVKAADPLSMQEQVPPVQPTSTDINTNTDTTPSTLGGESVLGQPSIIADSVTDATVDNVEQETIQTNLAPGVEPLAVDSNIPVQNDLPVIETPVNEPTTGNTLADLSGGIEAPQVDAVTSAMGNTTDPNNPVSEVATQTTLGQSPNMTTAPAPMVDKNIPSAENASAVLDQLIPNATESALPPLNGADNQVKKKAKGSSRLGLIILILLFFLVGVVLLLLGLYLSPAIDIEIPVVNDIFSSLGL